MLHYAPRPGVLLHCCVVSRRTAINLGNFGQVNGDTGATLKPGVPLARMASLQGIPAANENAAAPIEYVRALITLPMLRSAMEVDTA